MGVSLFDFSWMADVIFKGFWTMKEPDDCFFPSPYVKDRAWPILIIEVGIGVDLSWRHLVVTPEMKDVLLSLSWNNPQPKLWLYSSIYNQSNWPIYIQSSRVSQSKVAHVSNTNRVSSNLTGLSVSVSYWRTFQTGGGLKNLFICSFRFLSLTMSVTQDWSDALSCITPGFLDFDFLSCEDAEERIQEFIDRSPPSQYAVIRHIQLKEFEKLDECYSTCSRNDYFQHIELAVLYLKLPSFAHNWALSRFRTLFDSKALDMGISPFDHIWLANAIHQGARRNKEPDECFFPSPDVEDNAWPVLVIEVGMSETIRQLQRDTVWWFHQHSEVQYVLLMNLDTERRTITIEKWERAHRPDTRSDVLEPSATEVVTIDEDGVTGSFRLSFSTLFKKEPGPSQHDFQFGPELRMLYHLWHRRWKEYRYGVVCFLKRKWPGFGNWLVSLNLHYTIYVFCQDTWWQLYHTLTKWA